MAKKEQCYGIIPLRIQGNTLQVLLVLHVNGHFWAFPKGHSDDDEDPQVAAQRELFEETDLKVFSFLSADPLTEDYSFKKNQEDIHKFVSYYLAQVEGEVVLKEPHEVVDARWCSLQEAEKLMTFDLSRQLVGQLILQEKQLLEKIQES